MIVYMNKLIAILIFLSSLCFSYSYNTYYEFVYSNLIEKESGWVHKTDDKITTSKKNAIGVGQVTEIALKEYNDFHKKKYSWEDLYKRKINIKVSRWYFFQYLYKKFNGDIVSMVNSYNMGIGNNEKGKYNFEYLREIIPIEYSYWIRSRNVIRFYKNIWIIEK